MVQRRTLITLVSLKDAKEGFTFLHKGPSAKCVGCRYLPVCVGNLESGRVYTVVGLRDKRMRCELVETEMRVVEVAESEVETAIPCKQAMEGAIIMFHTQECGKEDCENLEICSPKGLLNEDRCEIAKVIGNLQCPQGFPLVRVVLQRVPPS